MAAVIVVYAGAYSPNVQGVQRIPCNISGNTRQLHLTKIFGFSAQRNLLFSMNDKLLFFQRRPMAQHSLV